MKTVFELIEANGLTLHGDIEHFAELVRADERERIYFQTSSDFVKAAIADEREACAKVCENEWSNLAESKYGEECADAIRARSNT